MMIRQENRRNRVDQYLTVLKAKSSLSDCRLNNILIC